MRHIFRTGLSFICLLAWFGTACAQNNLSLGSPKLLSKTGEALRVEIPIRIAPANSSFDAITVEIPNQAVYERLGISSRILDLNPSIQLQAGKDSGAMILLVESATAVDVSNDPFIDLIVSVRWPNGNLVKTLSILVGDTSKVVVKSGQTLSEIAAQMSPLLGGVGLDESMLALYKANPDAFAGGSIHRLIAGAQINKPGPELLRSITPSQAKDFALETNKAWLEQKGLASDKPDAASAAKKLPPAAETPMAKTGPGEDRLKLGPGAAPDADSKRYVEELVAQETALTQSRARVAELEKNIADLQKLLDTKKELNASKTASTVETSKSQSVLDAWGPAFLGLALLALTGILLWLLARFTRRNELTPTLEGLPQFNEPILNAQGNHSIASQPTGFTGAEVPPRAATILASLDLNLEPVAKDSNRDALRVKLNLAKAYLTIEDYKAALATVNEVIDQLKVAVGTIDADLQMQAQILLAEIQERQSAASS
ncbi:MAG: pilus assembly protein FimV [Polynucleobacter sp.]|nr:pilus assembly protein FimV [Polynucleobacter sp.]